MTQTRTRTQELLERDAAHVGHAREVADEQFEGVIPGRAAKLVQHLLAFGGVAGGEEDTVAYFG